MPLIIPIKLIQGWIAHIFVAIKWEPAVIACPSVNAFHFQNSATFIPFYILESRRIAQTYGAMNEEFLSKPFEL